MAIQFARIELLGRATGGNACCKSSYNARAAIKDINTNVTYNFSTRGDNVYHEVLLPKHVDKKFQNISKFMNEVESSETRKNSSLLKDIVIALPDDKELDLQDRINISHRIIDKMEWVKEGLGIQLDIHEPHDGEKNWHAHILLPKRRFAECGTKLGKKARDLDIQIRGGKNPFGLSEEHMIHEKARDVINDYFKEMGLETRVDAISINPEEHIGPVRMRSVMNAAVMRNEERREANINHLSSGKAVIDRVSASRSVFNRKDIQRELKCIPDDNRRSELFSEALENNSLVALYNEDGSSANYYTTHKIRLEEQKIMRLSGYVVNEENVVAANSNGKGNQSIRQQLISDSSAGLSQEQAKALSSILLDKSGLRVLRGRAGTGKSYVLGQVNAITSNSGINVIGLAPTHKAKLELRAQGFERVDTIKGMLFGLAHGRFDLPKHSLLVVDEAGMIGNDDMSELLRVAATRKCNVILAGDERQLASIQRGGMFEVFAKSYGSSTILDIQRQDSDWGKAVAMAFSKGEVATGLSILDTDDRIKWDNDASSSMHELLHDWSISGDRVRDRLILAVRNKDVAALNHGAREHFKLEGKLTGEEFVVGGNHYMKGDRILITKTNKKLGLTNGDLAEISYVSMDKFTLRFRYDDNVNNDKYLSFNPGEYGGFRHGYATTVFKAQGASILDVYVYHDGFSTLRSSYVSLSRHVEQLRLYVNKDSTGDMSILTRQLANDFENGSSLRYMSVNEHREALEDKEIRENFGRLDRMLIGTYDFLQKNITKFADKYISSSDYYNYTEPKQKYEPVSKVIDRTYDEIEEQHQAAMEEKLVVGGNINILSAQVNQSENFSKGDITTNQKTNQNDIDIAKSTSGFNSAYNTDPNSSQTGEVGKTRQLPKNRFYANADRIRSQQQYESKKAEWGRDYEQLKSEVRFKAEAITRDLLGDPNKHLSNGRELRYGDHGKIAVRITGEKAGTWYDFARGEGGDLFTLASETKGYDFKNAAEYLRSSVDMSASEVIKPNLQLVHDHANSDSAKEYLQEKDAKVRNANKLYNKSKPIGENAIANRYLKDHRNITCNLTSDIKTTGIYDKDKKLRLPALIAFARDKEGNITGGQHILLDKDSGDKADIATPKKSFGLISRSFVDLSNSNEVVNNEHKGENIVKSEITIITEGLETGLSVKQALCEHSDKGAKTTILCSLGISNIKNYEPYQGQKIIIASDNDGNDSLTNNIIADTRDVFAEKGAFVEIVKPVAVGDFNDILRDKSQGEKAIVKSFSSALSRHRATTLAKYFATDNGRFSLSQEEKTRMDYLAQFKINEGKIVDAYRSSNVKGRLELEKAVKPIAFTHACVKENMRVIDSANVFGANINKRQLVLSLVGKTSEEIDKHIIETREKHYFRYSLNDHSEDRKKAKTPEQSLKALKAEQDFLAKLHNNYAEGIHSKQLIKDINCAYHNEQNNSFNQVHKLTELIQRTEIKTSSINNIIKNSDNSQNALHSLSNKYNGYVTHVINKALDDIDEGITITSGKKSFTCGIKLIDHMLNQNKNNEFFPKEHIQSIRQELTKDHQLQHSFNGPSL